MSSVEVLSPPIQSAGDKKEYRLIKLPNGLKALLAREVSGSSTNESLAAVDVTIGVGSFDDPKSALGLAHFLEHMVHMGSEKYPEESGYNDFLTANGGKRNAMTGCQYTSYFFDVSEQALPEAIDRLAMLIASPLLLKNSMQREREAVDSEYEMKKSLESVQIQSIMKLLIKDSHPASQFDFGNLKSLKDDISDDDLHAELLKLHSKYVGNKMFVAVQSRRTLDEMQELVVSKFSQIKKANESETRTEASSRDVEKFFKPDFFERVFYIKPKSAKALVLTWAVPPILKHYKCSPMDYVSAIFANEGDGGIINFLRQQHLVTSIGIVMEEYSLSSNTDFALVRLVCTLTDLGTENIEKILEAIFSYLLMLKEVPIEEHRKLYDELQQKSQRDFDFHKELKPLENVLNIATNFLVYDDEDALKGNSVYQLFDESSIRSYIEALNQRKFNVILLTDKHQSFDKREKYFGTEYDDEVMPESYKTLWNERKLNAEFYLEKPNPFKTTNFEIFVNAEESPKYPLVIHDDGSIKVWHKLDDHFQQPHVNVKIKLLSPIVKASRENTAMMETLDIVMSTALQGKLSQASSAGYSFKMRNDRNGLVLEFEGFSDKISTLIDLVTKFLPSCMAELDEESFDTAKETLKKTCKTKLMTTYGLSEGFFEKVLVDINFTALDLYRLSDQITFDKLRKFSDKFFREMSIEVLALGNVTKSHALSFVEILRTNLMRDHTPEAFELKYRAYQLPIGSSVLRMKSLSPKDHNSFIQNFYQIGPDTIRQRNLARLVEAILSPKAYDFLRSKEQLGYGVGCKVQSKGGIVGISLIVLSQESKHNYAEVYGKMKTFMNEVAATTFDEITDDEFEIWKESHIKTLSADLKTLSDEATRNWAEITEHDYTFDRFDLSTKDTRNISKSELKDFFKSFTQPDNVRMLSVQVIGNPENENSVRGEELNVEFLQNKLTEGEVVITDIEEFQSRLTLYPVLRFDE